jgi:hypothetical protein
MALFVFPKNQHYDAGEIPKMLGGLIEEVSSLVHDSFVFDAIADSR